MNQAVLTTKLEHLAYEVTYLHGTRSWNDVIDKISYCFPSTYTFFNHLLFTAL